MDAAPPDLDPGDPEPFPVVWRVRCAAFPAPVAYVCMSLAPGEVIEGKYRIVGLIGEGGMGAVYEGENIRIQRRVAIKVLHAAFADNAEVVMRFQREAQAAGRIGNDHILEVLDLGALSNGDQFMVMEFLDGEPLSQRIKARGGMSPQELAPLMRQALAGLAAAHDAGIIHRDLKPDNIFILKEKAGHRDFVKIIDFGISKFQPINNEMRMTQTGAVMGTPYYMSPEQAHGGSAVDARSDIYAMGVILYEALAGRVPFDAATFNQLLFKIVLADATPLRELVPGADPAFLTLVEKAMARDPASRFQNARDFAAALQNWEHYGTAVSAPPPPRASLLEIAGGTAVIPPQGATGFSTSQPGQGTPVAVPGVTTSGNWAASQAGAPPARASRAPLYAVMGVMTVVGLGGGMLAIHMLAGGHETASSAQSAVAPVAVASQPAREPVVAPAPPSAPQPAESAPAAASAEAPASKTTTARASGAPHKPEKIAAAAPKPVVPPPPAPAPAPAKPGTPDFGY